MLMIKIITIILVQERSQLIKNNIIREKSIGTAELHRNSKKRKNSLSILKALFVPCPSESETSDDDRKVNWTI